MATKTGALSETNCHGRWRRVRFGDVVRDINESEREPLGAGLERFVGLEHLEPRNLHILRWGNLTQDEVSFTKRFRKGQVLFAKRRAYQRKIAVAEFDGICSSDILTFEAKEDAITPELLPFIVQSDEFFDHALDTSSGSLSPRTRWSQLKNYEFSLPPLADQSQIAAILWTVDDALQRYRDSQHAIEIAFSKLIESKLPHRNDSDAKFVQLSSLCATQPHSGIYKSEEFQGSGIQIAKMGTLFGNEVITDDIEMDLIQLDEKELDRFILTADDLLFGRRSIVLEGAGKCSRVGKLNKPVTFESSILRVTIDAIKADPAFIYTWLNSPEGKKELRRIRCFTTVAGITGSDLKKVKIPLMSRAQQDEIVSAYHINLEHVLSVSKHIQALTELQRSLSFQLLRQCDV